MMRKKVTVWKCKAGVRGKPNPPPPGNLECPRGTGVAVSQWMSLSVSRVPRAKKTASASTQASTSQKQKRKRPSSSPPPK